MKKWFAPKSLDEETGILTGIIKAQMNKADIPQSIYDDFFQDVFLEVWKVRRRLRVKGALGVMANKVARNRCVDFIKAKCGPHGKRGSRRGGKWRWYLETKPFSQFLTPDMNTQSGIDNFILTVILRNNGLDIGRAHGRVNVEKQKEAVLY